MIAADMARTILTDLAGVKYNVAIGDVGTRGILEYEYAYLRDRYERQWLPLLTYTQAAFLANLHGCNVVLEDSFELVLPL
jgi:hypothetical protein